MNNAFYTSGVSMLQHQQSLNVVANNLANINTVGYKHTRANFADLLYTQQNLRQPQDNTVGHGAKMSQTQQLMAQSSYFQTENSLDFAAPMDGFFAVANENGDVLYTKNGAFQVRPLGEDTLELLDASGMYVLDNDGSPIVLEKELVERPDSIVGPDEYAFNYASLSDTVGLFTFSNPLGLRQVGANHFTMTEISGEAIQNDGSLKPLQGFLEHSSVNISDEMTRMIVAQRAFQFSSRMLQAADEIQQVVNNLR